MLTYYLNDDVPNGLVIPTIGRKVRGLPTDKVWRIRIDQYKKDRSAEQNAYYWSAVLPTICRWHREHLGENVSPETMHEHKIKPLYCPFKVEVLHGQEVKTYQTTTTLKTFEFNDMIDLIVAEFAELGCDIPPPDPNWKKHERRPKEEK